MKPIESMTEKEILVEIYNYLLNTYLKDKKLINLDFSSKGGKQIRKQRRLKIYINKNNVK